MNATRIGFRIVRFVPCLSGRKGHVLTHFLCQTGLHLVARFLCSKLSIRRQAEIHSTSQNCGSGVTVEAIHAIEINGALNLHCDFANRV